MKIFAIKSRRTSSFVNFAGKNKVLVIEFCTLKKEHTASWDPAQPLISFVDGSGNAADPSSATYGVLFFKMPDGSPVTQANLLSASQHIRGLCTESRLTADPELQGYTLDFSNPRFYTSKEGVKTQAGYYGRVMTAAEYAVAYPAGEE